MRLKTVGITVFCATWILLFSGFCNASHLHLSKKTVIWVQKELKLLGYYKGKINGILDKKTEKAVKLFQKDHGLKVDGIPGRKTRKALKKTITKRKEQRKYIKTKSSIKLQKYKKKK